MNSEGPDDVFINTFRLLTNVDTWVRSIYVSSARVKNTFWRRTHNVDPREQYPYITCQAIGPDHVLTNTFRLRANVEARAPTRYVSSARVENTYVLETYP